MSDHTAGSHEHHDVLLVLLLLLLKRREPLDGGAAVTALALTRLTPAPTLPMLSHALEPAAVLHVAQRLGERVPPAWQLAIEGEAFELGAGLSAAARARLPLALAQARQWVAANGARSSATREATRHA